MCAGARYSSVVTAFAHGEMGRRIDPSWAVSKVVSNVLTLLNKERKSVSINDNVRTILYLIYLMNFGQHFYTLIASSSNYRAMLRERLVGCTKPRKRQKQSRQVVQKRTISVQPVSDSISVSGSEL